MGNAAVHISGREVRQLSVGESVLKTLAYFDIFYYPLTDLEIRQYLDRSITPQELTSSLQQLIEENKVFQSGCFYSIQDNPLLAIRREKGNRKAGEMLKKAVRTGRFLYKFPFTKAIGISGSLSKNYADDKADFDFFIITKSNRLWISRTLMHLYKKFTFLTGHQHFYCMNYYIDEEAMLLPEQNIFTAIEIKTLLPVNGQETMQAFFATNDWSDEWLPVCDFRSQERKDGDRSWFKKIGEKLFGGKLGDRLENYLFKLTRRRWDRKEEKGKRNEKGQPMGLITGRHFARSNPGAFQEKVLALYQQRLRSLNRET